MLFISKLISLTHERYSFSVPYKNLKTSTTSIKQITVTIINLCCRSLGNGLDNGRIVVRFSADVRDFYLLLTVQFVSGAYLASASFGAGCALPAVKRPGREADYRSLRDAEVTNEWRCTSTSPTCLHGSHRKNLIYLYFARI